MLHYGRRILERGQDISAASIILGFFVFNRVSSVLYVRVLYVSGKVNQCDKPF